MQPPLLWILRPNQIKNSYAAFSESVQQHGKNRHAKQQHEGDDDVLDHYLPASLAFDECINFHAIICIAH
jgi:hypothetical protein